MATIALIVENGVRGGKTKMTEPVNPDDIQRTKAILKRATEGDTSALSVHSRNYSGGSRGPMGLALLNF
jgi:hypothetical protein